MGSEICRRRNWPIPLMSVVGLALGARLSCAQQAPAQHELTAADIAAFADSVFGDYLRGSSDPSLAFVVVASGSIVFAGGYGFEDAAHSRAVDPDSTIFWMASLSKLVTTDAVMREVRRGRLTLNTPAIRHFGWPLPGRTGWRAITIEDLLTHTAGLDEPFMRGTVDDSAHLGELSDYLSTVRWRAGTRPGSVLRYSNHGMALAGLIAERTSGVPFAEYVEREIFERAGMSRSSFRQPIPTGLARRLATAGTDQALDYLLPAPAGAMVGTASDMGRFLAAQLDTGGPHEASLRAMHATHWRAHPAVPGVALGWFETNLGGVQGLYHTGARHHFSVAWLAPSQRAGLFLVHSMRQGGTFQNLRTEVVRAFVQRYFIRDSEPARTTTSSSPRSVEGIYRPALLGTTTVERAGYLFLDTPVRSSADGGVTVHVPGGLGTLTAYPVGDDVFEVREGPQADMRFGFVAAAAGAPRIAMGGTLVDPVVFTRLAWWQSGRLHAVILFLTCLALVLAAASRGVRWFVMRRSGTAVASNPAWAAVGATGLTLALAPITFAVLVVSTPEAGAAAHMRGGVRVVLTLLSVAAVLCVALPLATLLGWRRGAEGVAGRAALCVLSAAGVAAAALLWHYRLVGFAL